MIKAKKRFGQNFLVDPGIRGHILAAGHLAEGDQVIEIGPGLGAISEPILKTGAHLTAIEIDRDLIAQLQEKFKDHEHFTLIEQDALKVDWGSILAARPQAKLIANLPYNISSPLFFLLARFRMGFASQTIMLQKEVAQRMSWEEGDSKKDYGALTVAAQLMYDIRKICFAPPTCFTPQPKVDSMVIQLKPKTLPLEDEVTFLNWLRHCFNQRRKLLSKALKLYNQSGYEALEADWKERVDRVRPEELSPSDFLELYQALGQG